jgi:hypothetical protein
MRLMTVNFHLNVLNVEYRQTGIKNDADFKQEEFSSLISGSDRVITYVPQHISHINTQVSRTHDCFSFLE